MEKYKVTCLEDNKNFVATKSFLKLKNTLKNLKKYKGQIIHVIGAPGTGKSSNIYQAQNDMNLKMYNAQLVLKNDKISPKEVYNALIDIMKKDLNVKTEEEVYEEISKYNAVLFADGILDSGSSNEEKIGLTKWIRKNRAKSILFYFLLIFEYTKHMRKFRNLNIVFHTTWTFIFKEVKYDLLTDFSLLSLLFKSLLKLFFEVIEISYTEAETIKIIKSHFKDINEEQIKYYVNKFGCKPRLILNALENDHEALKLHNARLNTANVITKSR